MHPRCFLEKITPITLTNDRVNPYLGRSIGIEVPQDENRKSLSSDHIA